MVGLQSPETVLHRRHEAWPDIISDPHFCGDKNLGSWNAGCTDSQSDVGFVLIHLSRVDMAKALSKRGHEDALKSRPGHAVRSKSEHRNVCSADGQCCAGCVASAGY